MYQAKIVVGDFFEQKVMQLFDLVRADSHAFGEVPDLVSKEGSFFAEVKASAYNNGGVINKAQLLRFDRKISAKRFYAFAYHSIGRNMQRDYPTEDKLKNALNLKSLYLFPFSIIKAHFDMSEKITNPKHDDFVQLKERTAQDIFDWAIRAWSHLGLSISEYKRIQPHEKIHIVTREGYLEHQILSSFHPEFL